MTETSDLIDALAGIPAGSPLDAIRARRSEARANAQASYLALFESPDPTSVTAAERWSVALFVALLHGDRTAADFYRAGSPADAALTAAVAAEAGAGVTVGPYGHYSAEPLQGENSDGPRFAVSPAGRSELGDRTAAALEHAHLLVFQPREAAETDLQALTAAGWSTTEIVTLSQLVAFLSFQLRTVHGLRQLAAAGEGADHV